MQSDTIEQKTFEKRETRLRKIKAKKQKFVILDRKNLAKLDGRSNKKSVAMVINFVLFLFLVFHCKDVTNNIYFFVNIIIIIYIWPVLKTSE